MTLDEIRKETQSYKNMPKLERVVFHDYLVLDFSKFCEKIVDKTKNIWYNTNVKIKKLSCAHAKLKK